MGMFQRFVDRSTLSDEYDEYEDGYDEYADEEHLDAEVSPIRSVPSVPQLARIVTVHPTSFSEVRAFAEQYRSGLPVILNLTETDTESRKRIVDFALGLCFGLEGQLNKVSADVLLMTPHTVTMDEHAASGNSTF